MNFTSDLATGAHPIPISVEAFLFVGIFLLLAFQCKVLFDLGGTVKMMKALFDD